MSRSIELTGFQIIASNVFILKGYLFIGLYNPYWTRKTQGLCKPIWNRRAIKLPFKGGGKKKNLTLKSFIRFSFWNPSPLLQKKEFLLRFLYVFGFYNQAKSLTPTLKILLVFLCEAAANQLQQSNDCCGVNHVLGFVQRSKPHTRIRASDWLVIYLGAVH